MPLTVRHSLFSSFHSLKDVLRIFEVVLPPIHPLPLQATTRLVRVEP